MYEFTQEEIVDLAAFYIGARAWFSARDRETDGNGRLRFARRGTKL